ncbi:MAG: class I SAM-dependent methyltransferase [Chloroflexi bacterium]|nr:class I SAM-dependent methyltransferase [Chloroflexota bacterium]
MRERDSRPSQTESQWDSAEYVDWWLARIAREPRRGVEFAMVAAALPFEGEDAFRFLDLGAGHGALAGFLLQRFPRSEAVVLDGSEEMLQRAQENLLGDTARVNLRHASYAQPGWWEGLPPVHAIVSSRSIHNVCPVARPVPDLYREVRALLPAGGAFVNLDHVGPGVPHLVPHFRQIALERQLRQSQAELGRAVTPDELQAERRPHQPHRPHAPNPPLGDHLGWLAEAGFDLVECVWRDLNTAVVAGYVAP